MLALKVSAEVFVAAAMALSLAYALEYPGKMQLDRSTYVAIQRIYDPAFTLGRAISESLGVILTFALLLMTPGGTEQFNWVAAGFSSLIAMQAVYWTITYPVDKFWIHRSPAGHHASRRFYGLSATTEALALKEFENLWPAWQQRWEISQIARAFFGFVSVVTLAVAVAM
jgi:hypothetical protein